MDYIATNICYMEVNYAGLCSLAALTLLAGIAMRLFYKRRQQKQLVLSSILFLVLATCGLFAGAKILSSNCVLGKPPALESRT